MISREEIKHIYTLAKLDLREEDVDEIRTKFLDVIFEYVSKFSRWKRRKKHLNCSPKDRAFCAKMFRRKVCPVRRHFAHAYETEYGYFRLDRVVE